MAEVHSNRATHLAMRDKSYEEALGLLNYSFDGRSFASRKKIIYSLSASLENSYNEARFALRGIVADQPELDFVKFLKMALDAVRAVKHMIDHEGLVREDTGFLKRFLEDSPELLREFKNETRTLSADLLRALKIMARATEANFRKLKEYDFKSFAKDEKRRYLVMYHS